ncbi:MAG: FHA domain-containing protein [Planctomycetota bacterium]
MPTLEVIENGEKRIVRFTDTIVIGREPTNGVVIQDPMSSRRHCQLKREGGRFFLEDLESSNGTLLNGRRASRVELADGDRIEVGEVAVTFSLGETSATDGNASGAARGAAPSRAAAKPPEPAAPPGLLEEPEPMVSPEARPASGGGVFLRVVGGDSPATRLELLDLPFTIGRKAECGLVLNDRRVSGLHAQVVREGDAWFIEDCGSGNGVLVDKKRIKRHPLRTGESVLIGGTTIEFEGLPAEVASVATRARPAARAVAAAKRPEAAGDAEFRRIDVQQAVAQQASPLQAVWTGLLLVCFVAILFSGYVLVSNHFQQGRVATDPANLVNENASFEDVGPGGEIPGWVWDDAGDPGAIESFQAAGLPHGRRALRVRSGGSSRGFVRVLQEDTLAVSQVESGVQLSGSIANDGFALAGLEVLWYVQRTGGLELVAETIAPLVGPSNSFRTVSDVIQPPGLDVDVCRVAIFAQGQGTCTVDGISLKSVASAAEGVEDRVALRTRDANGLAIQYDRRGTTVLTRKNTTVLRNLRFAALTPGRLPFGQLTATKNEPPSRDDTGLVTSSFSFQAGGPGSHVVVDHRAEVRDERSLQLSWRIVEAPESLVPALVIEFEGRSGQQAMTVYDGDAAVLEGGTLEGLDGKSGTEWSLGEGAEQVCFAFSAPVKFRLLTGAETRGTPTMALELSPERDALFRLQVSSTSSREERQLAAWFEEVRVARSERRSSDALARLSAIEGAFPWREDARERARRVRAEIEGRANARVAELKAMLGELRQYPRSPIADLLRERAEALREEFAGASLATEAERVLNEVTRLEAESMTAARAEEAGRLLELGQQSFDVQRDHWARFYLERVIEMFPGTEEARSAKNLLDRVAVRN